MSNDVGVDHDVFSKPKAQKDKQAKKSSSSDRRKRRADEYEREGLESPDAFEACWAAFQADLLRIGFGLGDAVNQMLADQHNVPQSLLELEPSLSMYLRIARQIERHRQLEIRQAEIEQKASLRAASIAKLLDTTSASGDGTPGRPR